VVVFFPILSHWGSPLSNNSQTLQEMMGCMKKL
jgi:hypothetical protein